MVAGTLSKAVLKEAKGIADDAYWTQCARCNARVVRQALAKDGCFVCGWQPSQAYEPGEEVKALAEFLPDSVKQEILGLLTEDEAEARFHLKNCPSFSSLLARALSRKPETRKVLRERLFENVESLCKALRVLEDEKKSKTAQFLAGLDEKSHAIVFYLLQRTHAKIGELSQISGENDANTLRRIREAINPLAEKILGKPILVFRETHFQPRNGEPVPFSWWLDEPFAFEEATHAEVADVVDEDRHLRVLAYCPSQNAGVRVESGKLVIESGESTQNVPLAYVVERVVQHRFKNGLLEVTLEKKEA